MACDDGHQLQVNRTRQPACPYLLPVRPPAARPQRSGNGTLLEEGLVGTHMSLDNTLTKRCLTGRQRLLFVADVMQVGGCVCVCGGGVIYGNLKET